MRELLERKLPASKWRGVAGYVARRSQHQRKKP
jgi:hypothetical protein